MASSGLRISEIRMKNLVLQIVKQSAVMLQRQVYLHKMSCKTYSVAVSHIQKWLGALRTGVGKYLCGIYSDIENMSAQ